MGCPRKGGPEVKRAPEPIRLQRGGEVVVLPRCPVLMIPGRVVPYIHLHNAWTEGRYWAAGGERDQPSQYVKAMRIIGAQRALIRREDKD